MSSNISPSSIVSTPNALGEEQPSLNLRPIFEITVTFACSDIGRLKP